MTALKTILAALTGLSAGIVVSGAIFAFIAAIGVVPRLSHKTGTTRFIKVYEEAVIIGGIFGATADLFNYSFCLSGILIAFLSVCYGVFVGSVAVCLAEVLNVFPIMTRRVKLQNGLPLFITAFALGKLAGSLLYWLIPGFYKD